MNLEDFRARRQSIAAPPEPVQTGGASLGTFIARLRRTDAEEQKRSKLAIVIFAAVGIVMFVSAAQQNAVGVVMIAAVYMLIACLSWRRSRLFARAGYSVSTEHFLHEARNRYRFWSWSSTLIAIPGLGILYFGGQFVVQGMAQKYFDQAGQATALLVYVLFFGLLVVLGLIFSWLNWKEGNGKIVTEIQRMEQELKNG